MTSQLAPTAPSTDPGLDLDSVPETWRSFVADAPFSAALFDRSMRYLATSAAWRVEYGRGWPDLIGRSHYEVFPDLPEIWREVHRRGLAGEAQRNDRLVVSPAGERTRAVAGAFGSLRLPFFPAGLGDPFKVDPGTLFPPELQPMVQAAGPHGLLAVPMRAEGRILGVLSLCRSGPGPPYRHGTAQLDRQRAQVHRASSPPRLELGGRRDGDRYILFVRDNGVGFDMKFHDRIFGIFQRLNRSEDFPGTGVGLAIVRRAAPGWQRLGRRRSRSRGDVFSRCPLPGPAGRRS